jgi:hypothetical protein
MTIEEKNNEIEGDNLFHLPMFEWPIKEETNE